ncbi:hypothetical protein [Azospirillum sp. sgz301742]
MKSTVAAFFAVLTIISGASGAYAFGTLVSTNSGSSKKQCIYSDGTVLTVDSWSNCPVTVQ